LSEPIEARIQRIVNSLLPETAFAGEYAAPAPLAERMAFYHTPGVSLAVIDNFEVAWTGGFGLCEAGKAQPVDTHTLFQAASISKAVFALAVMRLVQEGRLDLDEDVGAYLKSWQIPAHGGWRPRITLRHLLNHSAGITGEGFPGYQAAEILPTLKQILNGEPPGNTPPILANILPGLQFRYSGGGFTVAQQVVMDVLGEPFPESMQRLVLEPPGMHDSTYAQPLPPGLRGRAASAHIYKGMPLPGNYHTYPEMAAAGLWTTPADLARLSVELLKVMHGKKSPSLVTGETIKAMLQPQLPGQKAEEDYFVGLGFFCGGKGQDFWFGHRGSNAGFVSVLQVYRYLGKGFAVMVNSNEFGLRNEIVRAIANEFSLPDVMPEKKAALMLSSYTTYAGTYLTKEGFHFNITPQEDGLALTSSDQPPLHLFASTDTEFYAKALNLQVSFEKDALGRVTAMTLNQEGYPFRAEKSPG